MSIWSGRGRDVVISIRNVFLAGSLTALAGSAAVAAVSPSGTIAGTVTLTKKVLLPCHIERSNESSAAC
jgi:hypothetical protein